MKRALVFLAMSFIASSLLAIDRTDCGAVAHLGALYHVRSLMMRRYTSSDDVQRFIDRRIDELREPIPDGGYRWVRWVRPSGNGPVEKKVHTVNAVQGSGDADSFEANGQHVYAVRVVVPSKRSLFKGNNPVYIGDVRVQYNNGNAPPRTRVEHINRWMQPDTSQTIDLAGIYDYVTASAQTSVEQRDRREAVAEIHFVQAVAQDDPANPAYSTIQALRRVRDTPDAATVDSEISALESTIFSQSDSLPLLTIVRDLRRADELIRSEKADDQEKGNRLLKETLRRLR